MTKTSRAVSTAPRVADFNGSGMLQTRYLHGPAIDALLARTSAGGTTAWYLPDRLGTIRDIANTSGTVIYHAAYDSYGNVTGETGTGGDRFKFTGREYDAETGLYYYRARYYDQVMGRFISQDPIGFDAGDANLYRYVGNGPTNATDPKGLQIADPPTGPGGSLPYDRVPPLGRPDDPIQGPIRPGEGTPGPTRPSDGMTSYERYYRDQLSRIEDIGIEMANMRRLARRSDAYMDQLRLRAIEQARIASDAYRWRFDQVRQYNQQLGEQATRQTEEYERLRREALQQAEIYQRYYRHLYPNRPAPPVPNWPVPLPAPAPEG